MTDCIGRHDTPAEGEPAVEADTGYLCYRCHTRLRKTIAELPAVAAWIEVNIAAGGNGPTDRITGSTEDPIPLRLEALDLIGPTARDTGAAKARAWLRGTDDQLGDPTIHSTLVSWSKLVHDEAHVAWPENNDLSGMATFLLTHLSWIVAQPWADEFMAEMLDLTSRASRIAPWRPETRRLKNEACTQCGRAALVTHVADGVTRCEKGLSGCGAQSFVSDYMQRARGREAS